MLNSYCNFPIGNLFFYRFQIDQTTHTITRDAYLANTSYHHQVSDNDSS